MHTFLKIVWKVRHNIDLARAIRRRKDEIAWACFRITRGLQKNMRLNYNKATTESRNDSRIVMALNAIASIREPKAFQNAGSEIINFLHGTHK